MNALPNPLRGRRGPGVRAARTLALTLTLALSAVTAGVSAQAQDAIPSQQEVDSAKDAVAAAAGSVAQIEAAYVSANARLAELRDEADLAAAAAAAAQDLLDERVAAVQAAAAAAEDAAEQRAKADLTLRRTAAQIYQEQGSMAGVGAFLDASGPQEMADRSAALSVVADLRRQALENATTTANLVAEAERGADLARSQQQDAVEIARAARATATQRADAAAAETARIAKEQEQRLAALATAKQTSVAVEQARVDGLARLAAEAEAARRAAEEARLAQEAAAKIKEEEAAHAKAVQAAKEAEQQAAAASRAPNPATPTPAPNPATPTPAPKPAPAPSAPAVITPVVVKSYPQRGLTPNAQALYDAIRNTFRITNIGGYRPGDTWGDHKDGKAVDVMTRSFAEGDAVTAWVQANHRAFGVTYIIWKQRIWFPGNAPDNWRMMADRGSITQNHYDHVHISVR